MGMIFRKNKKADGVREINDLINEYNDPGKPIKPYSRTDLPLFRPSVLLFLGAVVVFGLFGCCLAVTQINSQPPMNSQSFWKWIVDADECQSLERINFTTYTLRIILPIFTLGLAIVSFSQTISKTRRFTSQYFHDACRMSLFLSLCIGTILLVVVSIFAFLVPCYKLWFIIARIALSCSAFGAAFSCLLMLAFIIRETIRCSVESDSVRIASHNIARVLCFKYLRKAQQHIKEQNAYSNIKAWCKNQEILRRIHPPSEYFVGPRNSTEKNSSVLSIASPKKTTSYKEYCLRRLKSLDLLLAQIEAELYLAHSLNEEGQGTLGLLCYDNSIDSRVIKKISRIGSKAVVYRKSSFGAADSRSWDDAICQTKLVNDKAISSGNIVEFESYLNAIYTPISVMRKARELETVRDAIGENISSEYDLMRLYCSALKAIIRNLQSNPSQNRAYEMADAIKQFLWKKTAELYKEMDFRTMELFTWLIPELYSCVAERLPNSQSELYSVRAEFGGFYSTAGGWLEDGHEKHAQADVKAMQTVLFDGLTKWLIIAIDRKDSDLIEPLNDAGRQIAFQNNEIHFKNPQIASKLFVLAGHLMSLADTQDSIVSGKAIERLFFESHANEKSVNFESLIEFYQNNESPRVNIGAYLDLFYKPQTVKKDLLTRSRSSSGYGMMGHAEMTRSFVFLAAHHFQGGNPAPNVMPIEFRSDIEDAISRLKAIFKTALDIGFEKFKTWVDQCKQQYQAKDEAEVAQAELDLDKISEHKLSFWHGFKRSTPFFNLCIENQCYVLDDDAISEYSYKVPKIALFNWKYPISGADGKEYGRNLGSSIEQEYLFSLASSKNAASTGGNTLIKAIDCAINWLNHRGTGPDKGVIMTTGKRGPESQLFNSDHYVPSWKQDENAIRFNGHYKDYPVIRIKNFTNDGKSNKPLPDSAIAVDLSHWKGLRIRENVVSDSHFGELNVRTWTEEELDKAIQDEKISAEDVNKAKGNCPVEVALFIDFEHKENQYPDHQVFLVSDT